MAETGVPSVVESVRFSDFIPTGCNLKQLAVDFSKRNNLRKPSITETSRGWLLLNWRDSSRGILYDEQEGNFEEPVIDVGGNNLVSRESFRYNLEGVISRKKVFLSAVMTFEQRYIERVGGGYLMEYFKDPVGELVKKTERIDDNQDYWFVKPPRGS